MADLSCSLNLVADLDKHYEIYFKPIAQCPHEYGVLESHTSAYLYNIKIVILLDFDIY